MERYLQKVISETNGKLTMTKPKEEKMKNKTQKEREEFTKLAESVKLRIEQQRTPNEEGANSALKKLVDYHMEALSQKDEEVRREVLEEVKQLIKNTMVNVNSDVDSRKMEYKQYLQRRGHNDGLQEVINQLNKLADIVNHEIHR